MRFSKIEMQEELSKFLTQFGERMIALFGVSVHDWAAKNVVHGSPIWQAVDQMYDYGVEGLAVPGLAVPGGTDHGGYREVERFLHALDTLPMKIFLDDNPPPRLAILAARCASARLVLDGGDRQSDFAVDEFGPGSGDSGYLTLAEIALLADMDERSVRNAANPKYPNPLKTEPVGRRSLVRPEEARRWLADRKGFVATRVTTGGNEERVPNYDLTLPQAVHDAIAREAKELGIPFEVHLKRVVLEVAARVISKGDQQ